ncbi:MAG: NAD-dependent epimerase/dehydratase family protein [Gemmataceae bacterium]|nr:NAD-dependent epimerase/dehydratase family protein [Gemmataceae bacterium]
MTMAQFWKHRRALVTGGTGFLGWHLTHALLKAGARVRTFSLPPRGDHPITGLPVENQFGDIRNYAAVRKAVAGCDVVFHTAGSVAVWGPAIATMHAVHVEGTRNVLASADDSARVVHTSSIVAVGATRQRTALNEDSPFTLDDEAIDYVTAKRGAEQEALDVAGQGHDVVIVNPGYLVGPEDFEPSVMGKFCARVWKGRMVLAAPGGYNLVDVRDVADGHLRAAEHGQSGRRYILGGTNLSLSEFQGRLAEVARLSPRATPTLPLSVMWMIAGLAELRARRTQREPYPSFQHVRLNRYHWFADSARAIRELGYNPRPLEETVRDTFAWFSGAGHTTLRGMSKWWMRPAA